MSTPRFNTDAVIPGDAVQRLTDLGTADLLVGIPCFENADTSVGWSRRSRPDCGSTSPVSGRSSARPTADRAMGPSRRPGPAAWAAMPNASWCRRSDRGQGGPPVRRPIRKGQALGVESWTRMMNDFLAAARDADDLRPLIDAMVPLYFARTATFVRDTEGVTDEEAEARVETAVDVAVAAKPYLRERWAAVPAAR